AIAGTQEGEERGADGGHAGRKARRGLRALQCRNLLLERAHRRIAVTRVDVPFLLLEGYGAPRIEVVIAERDARDDRDLRRTLVARASRLAAPHGDRSHAGRRLHSGTDDDEIGLAYLRQR